MYVKAGSINACKNGLLLMCVKAGASIDACKSRDLY